MSGILSKVRISRTIKHLRDRWIGEPRQYRFNLMRKRLIRHRDLRAEKARSRSKRSFGILRIEKMSEEGICGIVKDDHRRQQVDRNV
jgi:hypothetical protein